MSAVGKNLPHQSACEHVSGESLFIDDIPPARNELLVDFFFSPVAHGRMKSLDLTDARKVDGVVALFTYSDIPGVNLFGPIIRDEVLLVEEICEFIGHPIVLIAGDSREALQRAKRAVKCEIEELPPVLTIDGARDKKQYLGTPVRVKRGSVDAGFKEAAHIIEGVLSTGGQEHFYFESQAAIAYPGEKNQLVVHSSTQNPTEGQHVIADLLGLRHNQVTCITCRVGGAFGGKECQATHFAAMAALVAFKTGRPARCVLSKDTDMNVTGKRHPFQNHYKVGFTSEGVITALEAELFADGGAKADLSPAVVTRAITHIDNAYYLDNVDVTGLICKTNYPPNTAFRGFGAPQGIVIIENILEEIARFLKKDSYDIRRLNLYGIDVRNTTPYGQIVFNNTLPRVYDELVEKTNYRERKGEIDEFNRTAVNCLRGISLTGVKFGISFNSKFLNQASALVNIFLDGTIQVSTGAIEMGQGVNTNICQLVAGEFDISADDVLVMATSTEKNNNTPPTAASCGTDLNGKAAVKACQALKERLGAVACDWVAASGQADLTSLPDSIVFENGAVYDKRCPTRRISFEELVNLAWRSRVSLGERGFYATEGVDFSLQSGPEGTASGNPFLYFTNGAAVSEVLIDCFTGSLSVVRCDLLMDAGKPINPGIHRGQISGGFIQGMGWVTTEELRYAENGQLLTHSPSTYKIPNIQDIPAVFNIDWIDSNNPVNIKGTKAVGEPPFVLALSVWTAIKYALSSLASGAIIPLRLPATSEEILRWITLYTTSR